jgi:response regulator RpfG family c-di-GMP phosphodiesterase
VEARQTIRQYIEDPWNMSDYQMNVRLKKKKKHFLAKKKESMTAISSLIL